MTATLFPDFAASLLRAGLSLWLFLVLSPHPAAAGSWQFGIHPTSLAPGEVALVELAPADAVSSATITWQSRRIPLVSLPDNRRLAALLGIPRETNAGPASAELEIVDRAGLRCRRTVTLQVGAKPFGEQRLTLPESQVNPDGVAMRRHRAERQTLEKVFAGIHRQRLWQSPFRPPLTGQILSPFGVRRILNGEPRSYHSGVDLRARLGEPVAAAGDGLVVLVADHFFAGKSVYIDHGMGIVTMYFHLAQTELQAGQRVAAGQRIGLAGASGRASGPHLHWGARVHDCKVDPLALVRLLGASVE